MTLKKFFIILVVANFAYLTSAFLKTHEWRCVWNQVYYGVTINPGICPKTDHE